MDDLQQRRQQIADLSLSGTPPEPEGDWRSTVGMFDNDPIAKEISEYAREARNQQRQQGGIAGMEREERLHRANLGW